MMRLIHWPRALVVLGVGFVALAAFALGVAGHAPVARAADAPEPTVTVTTGEKMEAPTVTLWVEGKQFIPTEPLRVILCPTVPTGPGDPGPIVAPVCAPTLGTVLGDVTADGTGYFSLVVAIASDDEDRSAVVEVLRGDTAVATNTSVIESSVPPTFWDNAGLLLGICGLPLLFAIPFILTFIRGVRDPNVPQPIRHQPGSTAG